MQAMVAAWYFAYKIWAVPFYRHRNDCLVLWDEIHPSTEEERVNLEQAALD